MLLLPRHLWIFKAKIKHLASCLRSEKAKSQFWSFSVEAYLTETAGDPIWDLSLSDTHLIFGSRNLSNFIHSNSSVLSSSCLQTQPFLFLDDFQTCPLDETDSTEDQGWQQYFPVS
ncbi:hypothetical protein M9H77_15593 [Catharanthus roseus]|uniref:Uncharacterized protein n=1 Tax=Catharanthus roseus TaxID=4058 RepID=A0ACC0AY02_CATRO|nr:hypothetical protein M9H77_15593 [Catharanthus roseus]